jgi:hypothetical protein
LGVGIIGIEQAKRFGSMETICKNQSSVANFTHGVSTAFDSTNLNDSSANIFKNLFFQ